MVKLQRANAASDAERKAFLASAETAFLAIQEDAEGLPTYHLGLGRVYYRLGRPDDGNTEFNKVLDRKEAPLTLAVARAYRGLGVTPRAQEIAENAFNGSVDQDVRSGAAILMALMSESLDEREKWYKLADAKTDFVKTSLWAVEAQRLMKDGKYAEADAKLAKVAAVQLKDQTSAVAANNAALTLGERFRATLEIKYLKQGVATLERAFQTAADEPLVVQNLASMTEYAGTLRVLSKWLDTNTLRLEQPQLDEIVTSLLQGPLHDELLKRFQQEPMIRRATELWAQVELLAPTRVDAYRRQAYRYYLAADLPRLDNLSQRLGRAKLELGNARSQWKERLEGLRDEELASEGASQSEYGLELELMGKKRRLKRVRAAGMMLTANALQTEAWRTGATKTATQAVTALENAHDLWPDSGAAQSLPFAQLLVATLSARANDAKLNARWEAERREFGLAAVLSHHAASNGSLAALLKQAESKRALKGYTSHPTATPGAAEARLAPLLGNPALTTAAAAAKGRAELFKVLTLNQTIFETTDAAEALQSLRGD